MSTPIWQMMPTEILEDATPEPWREGLAGYGDGVRGDALLYWATHHFEIDELEEFEQRVTAMDSATAKLTLDGRDYAIPDCCYVDYWYGDSSPWSLPRSSQHFMGAKPNPDSTSGSSPCWREHPADTSFHSARSRARSAAPRPTSGASSRARSAN